MFNDKELPLLGRADLPASTLADRVARGQLRRLAPGLYTSDLTSDLEQIVRQHLFAIAGALLPGAVITDRSARSGGPVSSVLYLARSGRPRTVELPGCTLRVRRGAPPVQIGPTQDIRLPGGLFLASGPRGLAENCLPSRARQAGRRTLTTEELGDWVDQLCQSEGSQRLHQLRQEVEQLAPMLGMTAHQLAPLQAAIGVALGTKPAQANPSSALASRRQGRPVDQSRIRRFEILVQALRVSAPQSHPARSEPQPYLPFFEAYFSNFIEGTEFEVDEAARIVFDGKIPAQRRHDAHDIVGTYRLVADAQEMSQTGQDGQEFLQLLRHRNASILGGRPQAAPGQFKQAANRAGETHFVAPDLVEGTLLAGLELRDHLDTAWERAVYVAFLVAEVHPFVDGNGRTARVMMNAELHAGGQCRIIVPTVFRQDYLDGLRLLSRRDDPSVFIKAMRYVHDMTAAVNFSSYIQARDHLTRANAFRDPDSPHRLHIPRRELVGEITHQAVDDELHNDCSQDYVHALREARNGS